MADPQQSAEQLFLSYLDLIEKLLRIVARRYALHGDEPEEFEAWVKLKMVEDNYAVLRKFRGEAKLRTYLTSVFVRLAKDWLIAQRGKWRISARARQTSLSAMQLETLISYEGRTMDEAVEVVKRNFGAAESRDELHRLAEELPQHPPRSQVSLETLAEPSSKLSADRRVVEGEMETRSEDVSKALAEALQEMPAGDRLVLEMHYGRGMTVASIARVLKLPQRPMYSRVERLLSNLRAGLESRGVHFEQVQEVFGWVGGELEVDFGVDSEAELRRANSVKSPRSSVLSPGRSGEGRKL